MEKRIHCFLPSKKEGKNSRGRRNFVKEAKRETGLGQGGEGKSV